jgi:hypothetical protein
LMSICPRCKVNERTSPTNYCPPCRRANAKARRRPKPTLAERFWAKVRKETHEREPGLGPCWIWTGSINPKSGYGMFQTGERVSAAGHRTPTQAHIVSCRLAGKVLPAGHEWDHLCSTRRCVEPSHLQAVTHRENIRRGLSIVAGYMDTDRHKCGHLKGSEHTYYRPDGSGTHCGTCSRQRAGDNYREANQAKRRAEEALQQVPF